MANFTNLNIVVNNGAGTATVVIPLPGASSGGQQPGAPRTDWQGPATVIGTKTGFFDTANPPNFFPPSSILKIYPS